MKFLLYFSILSLIIGCSDSNKQSIEPVINPNKEFTKPGILFFGDSLTAGLGLQDPEKEAWPSLIGKMLDEKGLTYEIWNAGLSGDTTSGGLGRLDFTLRRKPEVFVLELGANDSMRGVPVSETRKNLEAIIDRVRERYPDTKILLVGIKTFPNLGLKYKKEFDNVFTEIAESKKLLLVPFLLEGVAGVRYLNQEDGIHPTEEGHKIMANTVYPYLKKLL